MATLGIKFPDTDSLPIEEVLHCAQTAEAAGFDSLWMSDYKSGDVFAVLAACAVVTERIQLGTGVAVVFNRAPTTLAMAAASVDTISKGRLILGLGQGHKSILENENGLTYVRPLQHLIEYTEIIRALLRDGKVSYRGELFQLDYQPWVKFYRPRFPIWYPPMFPKSWDLCGRLADGAVATQLTAGRTPAMVQGIQEGARKAGRDPSEIEIGSYLLTVVTKDKAAGRRLVKHHMAWYVGTFTRYSDLMCASGYEEVDRATRLWQEGDQEGAARLLSDELADGVAMIGEVDEIRGKIEEYRAAGLQHPILYPMPLDGKDTKGAFLDAVRVLH